MHALILFEDVPDAPPDLRQRHMAAHKAFLAANANRIHAAGPLHEADGTGAGGVWHIEVDDFAKVTALIEADPFFPTGLRKSWRILRWTRVYPD